MAAFNGRLVTIDKNAVTIEDELRTKTVNFNGELVDVTTSGDSGWTTTLDGVFNTNNVTLAIDGVIKNTTLSDMAFSGAQDTFTITVSDLFTLTGTWQFQAGFSIGAPYDGESTISGTLQSVGEITKAPVV